MPAITITINVPEGCTVTVDGAPSTPPAPVPTPTPPVTPPAPPAPPPATPDEAYPPETGEPDTFTSPWFTFNSGSTKVFEGGGQTYYARVPQDFKRRHISFQLGAMGFNFVAGWRTLIKRNGNVAFDRTMDGEYQPEIVLEAAPGDVFSVTAQKKPGDNLGMRVYARLDTSSNP